MDIESIWNRVLGSLVRAYGVTCTRQSSDIDRPKPGCLRRHSILARIVTSSARLFLFSPLHLALPSHFLSSHSPYSTAIQNALPAHICSLRASHGLAICHLPLDIATSVNSAQDKLRAGMETGLEACVRGVLDLQRLQETSC